ncbi:MAG: SDR family oxidoreductase [Gracilibacteraceae bacterium]|nr:SDR family oxidoreductase [Gracilibacteraceae bacterium]
MELGLKRKVAIITGVDNPRGIGAAAAFALAREGVRLVLVYKDREDYESKAVRGRAFRVHKRDTVDLRLLNASFLVLEENVSNERGVKSIFDRAFDRYERVDILVNALVHSDDDSIETLTAGTLGLTFQTNVTGTLLMAQEFVERRGDYGRIINIASDAVQCCTGRITYGVNRAAVEGLTRRLAAEIGRYGITVNCIAPGPTQTGWSDEELALDLIPQIPLGKLVQPEDIADTIVFLASARSALLTGQVVEISGGYGLPVV